MKDFGAGKQTLEILGVPVIFIRRDAQGVQPHRLKTLRRRISRPSSASILRKGIAPEVTLATLPMAMGNYLVALVLPLAMESRCGGDHVEVDDTGEVST